MTPPLTQPPRAPDQVRTLAGWREWLAPPRPGVPGLKGKPGTRARDPTLHAFFTEPFRQEGQDWLRFGVHPLQHRLGLVTICTAQVLDRRIVSDSGGHRESRWVIATPLRLGTGEWTIELTLTDRDSMLFRMLLGRSAMSGRLLVDPQGSYLASRKPRLKRLYPALAAGDPSPR